MRNIFIGLKKSPKLTSGSARSEGLEHLTVRKLKFGSAERICVNGLNNPRLLISSEQGVEGSVTPVKSRLIPVEFIRMQARIRGLATNENF